MFLTNADGKVRKNIYILSIKNHLIMYDLTNSHLLHNFALS